MKIKELLYKTPEMTEEKLLKLIIPYIAFLKKDLRKKLINKTENKDENKVNETILKEWDLIQEKKSLFTKSQRDQICSVVSCALIEMAKGNDEKENFDEYEELDNGTESTGTN